MPDLDALLDRIGLDSAPPPTLAGLDAMQRAFVERVPFEDLAIHLGETEPLHLDRVQERVLAGGRGGYCFELNGLFAWMAEQLGFGVQRRESVVGPHDVLAPTNHLGLVVTPQDAGPRLAEVGFGQGPLQTLALAEGRHTLPGSSFSWNLAREDDGGWWWTFDEHVAVPGIRIGADTVGLDAFAPHHERVSTSPESRFVQTLVIQRPSADRFVSLRARTVAVDGPGHRDRRVVADADDLAEVLDTTFAIDPGVLGPARIERLWERAWAQHEAWQREAASPAGA